MLKFDTLATSGALLRLNFASCIFTMSIFLRVSEAVRVIILYICITVKVVRNIVMIICIIIATYLYTLQAELGIHKSE